MQLCQDPNVWENRGAVATSMVGQVSSRPLFEATATFLPIFTNSVAHLADWLAATGPQLIDLEIDGCK